MILAKPASTRDISFLSPPWEVCERIRSLRFATVVCRLPSYMWDAITVQLDSPTEGTTKEEAKIFLLCPLKRMIIRSDLLKIVQPLMEKVPARKFQKNVIYC